MITVDCSFDSQRTTVEQSKPTRPAKREETSSASNKETFLTTTIGDGLACETEIQTKTAYDKQYQLFLETLLNSQMYLD